MSASQSNTTNRNIEEHRENTIQGTTRGDTENGTRSTFLFYIQFSNCMLSISGEKTISKQDSQREQIIDQTEVKTTKATNFELERLK